MMNVNNVKFSQSEVLSLLKYFDYSSDSPLHESLDFSSYSEKLSKNAYFITAEEQGDLAGFIAYYLNDEGEFAYIPQIVVHKDFRHRGVGHLMMDALINSLGTKYKRIMLEVLKTNMNARRYYLREGFAETEDRNERLLLQKNFVSSS